MKTSFIAGALLLMAFELANVWFIMPLPYSQRIRSIDVAYALYSWRWAIRALALLLMVGGLRPMWRAGVWRRVAVVGLLLAAGGVSYMTNMVMAADRMFLTPSHVTMLPAAQNTVEKNRLVVGITLNGDARAYPVQFLGYHHQVRDTVGGEPVLVTYCTVCRTGRVFSPSVRGKTERFRLVGMDHFNAMIEDASTGTWWRQANGAAVSGALTGDTLREIPSQQVTLAIWLEMHPESRIMQADSTLRDKYPKTFDYETGLSKSALTGTDTVSWRDKAWVVGVEAGGEAKAFDWRALKRARVINEEVGGTPVVVVLAQDSASFFVYARPHRDVIFSVRGDSLVSDGASYGLSGRGATGTLVPLQASQEFWHSWREFKPGTRTWPSPVAARE